MDRVDINDPEAKIWIIKSVLPRDNGAYYKAPSMGVTPKVDDAHLYSWKEAQEMVVMNDNQILLSPKVVHELIEESILREYNAAIAAVFKDEQILDDASNYWMGKFKDEYEKRKQDQSTSS